MLPTISENPLPPYLQNMRLARKTDSFRDLSYDHDQEVAEVQRMQEKKDREEVANLFSFILDIKDMEEAAYILLSIKKS